MIRLILKIALGVTGMLLSASFGSTSRAQGFSPHVDRADPYGYRATAPYHAWPGLGDSIPGPGAFPRHRSPIGWPDAPGRFGLSGRLVAEVDAFLVSFMPTAHIVPQGRQMATDAQRLLDAAIALDLAMRQGSDPRRLNALARDVDRHASRLVNRVDRVARGRIGPNIAQVYRIGAIAGDLQRVIRGV